MGFEAAEKSGSPGRSSAEVAENRKQVVDQWVVLKSREHIFFQALVSGRFTSYNMFQRIPIIRLWAPGLLQRSLEQARQVHAQNVQSLA